MQIDFKLRYNTTDSYTPQYNYKLNLLPFAKLASEVDLNMANKLLKWNQLGDSCSRISREAFSLIKNHQEKQAITLIMRQNEMATKVYKALTINKSGKRRKIHEPNTLI